MFFSNWYACVTLLIWQKNVRFSVNVCLHFLKNSNVLLMYGKIIPDWNVFISCNPSFIESFFLSFGLSFWKLCVFFSLMRAIMVLEQVCTSSVYPLYRNVLSSVFTLTSVPIICPSSALSVCPASKAYISV